MKITDRIKQYIDFKGITRYKFHKDLGLSNGFLDKSREISTDKYANILAYYPDINAEWLLTGKGKMIKDITEVNEAQGVYTLKTDRINNGNQLIPLYDIEAVAGLVPLFKDVSAQNPIDHISIPNLPKCDGAIKVTGDSMYPLLKSGDIIMYKQIHDIGNDIFWGEMYLLSVETDDEEYITVKYIQHSDKGEEWVKLVSQNKNHQERHILKSRIKALALVKAIIRINSMS